MNIFTLIKQDHEKVLDLLQSGLDTSGGGIKSRDRILENIKDELIPHMRAEENFFYKYLLQETDEESREMVFEALEEHRAAEFVLRDTESVPSSDEQWHPRLKVLQDLLSHHIDEEENDIFPMAEQFIGDELAEEMGEKFESIKEDVRHEITV